MKYYLCAEGGGSKLLAILYDENFSIVRTARAGSVNDVFKDKDEIRREMETLVEELVPPEISVLAGADISLVGGSDTLSDAIRARFVDVDLRHHGEGAIALAASGAEEGIIAQAGTGSDAFLIQKDQRICVGGWGSIIGDQGSGYDIGRRGVEAAVRYGDGWGEPTLITELLREHLRYVGTLSENFSSLVRFCLDRTNVASVSRIVGAAAAKGDRVALSIVRDAGRMLAEQVLCAIRRAGGSFRGPVIASGGAWRTSPVMFETFCECILSVHPDAVVMRPVFEPVVGCIVSRFGPSEELMQTLRNNFKQYLY